MAAHDEVEHGVAAHDATNFVLVSQSLSLLDISLRFSAKYCGFTKNNLNNSLILNLNLITNLYLKSRLF